jgi:hypothetical protein
MADQPHAKPTSTPRSKSRTPEQSRKETADERRARQKEAVNATQITLKREAAERRAKKLEG